MGKQHFRRPMQGFIVGALESVAFERWASQGTCLGQKIFDIARGDIECVVVQESIDPEQQIQQGAEPCEPGIIKQ